MDKNKKKSAGKGKALVSKPEVSVEPSPAATVEVAPTPAVAGALTFADFGLDVPNPPTALAHFTAALRTISALPVGTREERVVACDRFREAMEGAMPNTPLPTGRHTGRFSGMPVFESQNLLYVAAALANVPLHDGHIVAAWRAELPNAKCDYLTRVTYGRTTLSEYCNGRHNAVPGVAGASALVNSRRRPAQTGAIFDHGTAADAVKKVG